MSIELIRLKISCDGQGFLSPDGSVVIQIDGCIDYFGDLLIFSEPISNLLQSVDFTSPMGRISIDDLTGFLAHGQPVAEQYRDAASCDGILVDTLQIGERRVIGPLLLRRGQGIKIGGAIDATVAAMLFREFQLFSAVRQRSTQRLAA